MNTLFDPERLQQLKTDAYENIESYSDPQKPKALANYTAQMKTILQADPSMLEALPEYLPVALFGRVKFSDAAKQQWPLWLNANSMPAWDDFKVSVAFNNDDLALVKTIRTYNEKLLIEACAVLFLLTHDTAKPNKRHASEAHYDDDDDASDGENTHDDYEGNNAQDDDANTDQYDEITFN
jgi:hypothetical protein